LDNTLDGHWRFISIDPASVVKAQMRIARVAAQAVVVATGIAATAQKGWKFDSGQLMQRF